MLPTVAENIPGFVRPASLYRTAAAALRPPEQISVSECAERHRRLNNPGSYVGPWRNAKAPWLVEPMDRCKSRDFDEIYFVGPSQISGKTELELNVIGHTVKYAAGDMLIIQPTKDLAEDFSNRRVDKKFLGNSPDFAAELGGSKSDDKVYTKNFRNGSILSIIWPSVSQLSSRPVPIVLVDERDRIADDIGGEGDPIILARARKATYKKLGILVCVSSPSRETESGIIVHYRESDRNLWAWPCLACGEYWTPGFDEDRKPTVDHLDFDASSVEAARSSAVLVCTHCGGVTEDQHRLAMNDRAVWVPQGMRVTPKGVLEGNRPNTRIAGYWFCGLASPFTTLGDIAADILAADTHFDRTGEEQKLRGVYNTKFGFPYRSQVGSSSPLDLEELKARVEDYRIRTVPLGVKFLTASVDVGTNRFDVIVKGWGEDTESWLIDRYAIRQLADGRTDLKPFKYPEHWNILLDRVIRSRYPLAADPTLALPIATTAIDTGGGDDTTDNARAFWKYARRKRVQAYAITLIKGSNNPRAPIMPLRPTPEKDDRGRVRPEGTPMFVIGVSALKEAISNRMRREDPGPGYMHTPDPSGDDDTQEMLDRYFEELLAERKVRGEWVRQGANESFDLEIYADFARRRLLSRRVNWNNPPAWSIPRPLKDYLAPDSSAPDRPAVAKPARKSKPVRRSNGSFATRWKS